MKTKQDYWKQLGNIENDVLTDIETALHKIGRSISNNDKIEFFGYEIAARFEIESISENSTIEGGSNEGVTLRQMVDDGSIPIVDLIQMIDDLRKLKN